jgi:hypothetical protein
MTYPNMQHIPLKSAYLCQDCNSIGNCSAQCPACASSVLLSLAGVLDRDLASAAGPAAFAYTFPKTAMSAGLELESLVA